MLSLFRKDKKRVRNFRRERDIEITTPISIRLFVLVCVISIIGALFFGITTQLDGIAGFNSLKLILISLSFFLLPILITMSISNEHRSSQYLIALFCSFVAYQLFDVTGPTRTILQWGLIVGFSAGSFWWLFFSKKIRTFYAVLSETALPLKLEQNIEKILEPKQYEKTILRITQKLEPYVGTLLLLTMLSTFIIPFALAILSEW